MLFYLLLLLGISQVVQAQKSDPVFARAYYIYQDKQDTIYVGKTRTEDMILFMGKNSSLFGSFSKIKHEINEDRKIREKIQLSLSQRPKAIVIDQSQSFWMTNTTYLHQFDTQKLHTTAIIAYNPYLIEEKAPRIDWKILKDTLTIAGLKCQKAIGELEGTNWEVFFTDEIAYSAGPYKLHGLPGLIIQATSADKNQIYTFNGMENASENRVQRDVDITKRIDAQPGDYNPIDQAIGRDMGNAYFENYIRMAPNAIKAKKEDIQKLIKIHKINPTGLFKKLAEN